MPLETHWKHAPSRVLSNTATSAVPVPCLFGNRRPNSALRRVLGNKAAERDVDRMNGRREKSTYITARVHTHTHTAQSPSTLVRRIHLTTAFPGTWNALPITSHRRIHHVFYPTPKNRSECECFDMYTRFCSVHACVLCRESACVGVV